MSVLLITNPAFSITFADLIRQDAPKGLSERVYDCVKMIFIHIRMACTAVKDSIILNLRYSITSFRFIVYDFLSLRNQYVGERNFALRLGLWIMAHTVGFVAYSIILYVQKTKTLIKNLIEFASREINLTHFATKNSKIDVSNVPATVTVDKLLEIYDRINFSNPENPGYMPPSCRKESNITFSPAQLRLKLVDFVQRVKNREAFLGTPPAIMAPQLMQFYEQIENAVRFSLHKVLKQQECFLAKHDGKSPQRDDPDYQQYQNNLEDQARIAIDMAIAGAHCGARYMSDAMDCYFRLQEQPQFDTLQDRLQGLLAQKREKIARQQIQTHMGTDAHAFSSYMANLGSVLAIPGTENILEYLTGRNFNKPLMLRRFFETYTPACIRETVQEEIKRSQAFREVLFDWLKDHAGAWKKESYAAKLDTIMPKLQAPIEQQFYKNIETYFELVDAAKEQVLPDPKKDFDTYLDELFALDSSKQKLSIHERQRLKLALKKEYLRQELIHARVAVLKEKASVLDQVAQINRVLNIDEIPAIDEEVLIRCLVNKQNLKEILGDHLQNIRKSEFLEALTKRSEDEDPALAVTTNGLKKDVLDWVLIANKILLPSTPS